MNKDEYNESMKYVIERLESIAIDLSYKCEESTGDIKKEAQFDLRALNEAIHRLKALY